MNTKRKLRLVVIGSLAFYQATTGTGCSDPPAQDLGPSGGTAATGGSSALGGSPGIGGFDAIGGSEPSAGPPFGHFPSGTTFPSYDGFTLWLAEEFDTPIDLDKDPIWTWSDGELSEGQTRFVKTAITFVDGKMVITVDKKANVAVTPDLCSHAENGKVFSMPLYSGELRTRYNQFRYGRYEVSLKAPSPSATDPKLNGNYISTLFVFRTPKYQQWRELDIELTGDGTLPLTSNLLYADSKSTWSANIAEVNSYALPNGVSAEATRTDYHTFAFEWLPERVTWYVDGVKVREKLASSGGLPIPEKSAKIMMNLWVFSATAGFGGTEIQNNTYPMMSSYEYFRFYKWNNEQNYPCATPEDHSCLAAEDLDLSSNNPCDGLDPSGTDASGAATCRATCNP